MVMVGGRVMMMVAVVAEMVVAAVVVGAEMVALMVGRAAATAECTNLGRSPHNGCCLGGNLGSTQHRPSWSKSGSAGTHWDKGEEPPTHPR